MDFGSPWYTLPPPSSLLYSRYEEAPVERILPSRERNFVLGKLHRIFSLLTRDHRFSASILRHTDTTLIENFAATGCAFSFLPCFVPSGPSRCPAGRDPSRRSGNGILTRVKKSRRVNYPLSVKAEPELFPFNQI